MKQKYHYIIILSLLLISCHANTTRAKWVNVSDKNDYALVTRVRTRYHLYEVCKDSFDNHFCISFYHKANTDTAKIIVSTLDSSAITTLISKENIRVNDHVYTICQFKLDDTTCFDEDLSFVWISGLGLTLFKNNQSGISYRYSSENPDDNTIICAILQKLNMLPYL